MNKNTEDLVRAYNTLSDEITPYLYLTRDITLQNHALERSKDFLERLSEHRKLCQRKDQCREANLILAMEISLTAVSRELQLWIQCKQDQGVGAWDALVEAQMHYGSAITVRHQIDSTVSELQKRYDRLVAAEKILFSRQIFLSVGGDVLESECSICGQAYDSCTHVKGRAYCGNLCSRKLTNIRPTEISIVDDPADKRCRLLVISDGAVSRDPITWRVPKSR